MRKEGGKLMRPLTAAQVKKIHADIDLLGTDVIDFKTAKKAYSAYERVFRLIEHAEDKLYGEWGEDFDNSMTY
jgi:hypothetical protein